MENKFESLKNGEVICVGNPIDFLIGHHTFRVSELSEALKRELLKRNAHGLSEEQLAWLSEEGSECAVLKFGAPGWQKGKLRIDVQFCPDESEVSDVVSVASQEKTMEEVELSLDTEERPIPEQQFSPQPPLEFSDQSTAVMAQEQSDLFANDQDEFFEDNFDDEDEDQSLDISEISKSLEHELEAVENTEESDPFEVGESMEDDDFDFQAFGDEPTEGEAEDDFSNVWQDIDIPNS